MKQKHSVRRKRTAAELARLKRLRDKFEKAKPSLDELVASGEFTEPVNQGELVPMLELAAAIRSARQARKLSLADVARRTGIDKSALSRIENGLNTNPTLATLESIARSLGSRLRVLLEPGNANSPSA
jgi:DNA-binding XRE family transcriptional regulator